MSDQPKTLVKSIKWSGLGEIGAKLITPFTTIILARVLDPQAFGVIAICNMLITFVDILVEAGFSKYIVQKSFSNEDEKNDYSNVTFWSQLGLAIILYGIICCFNQSIAKLLGNEEYGFVISVASLQLVFVSLSSTHIALLRRDFEFKKLFTVRLVTALGPLCFSVPLAILLRSYWALIIGTLSTSLITTLLLFHHSKWIPQFTYSLKIFKDMWNYSFWSLCEGIAHWAIWWIDIFIIGHFFSIYYVGLYKNSTHIVMSIFGLFSSAMSPVLLSSLSKIKSNLQSNYIIYNIEQSFMFLLLPIGFMILFNDNLVTNILLGQKWKEASPIVGAWSIMMAISLIIYSFPAEAFKARGIPRVLFTYQLLYLITFTPICIIAAKIDYWWFVYTRCACIIIQMGLFVLFVSHYLHWSIPTFLKLSYSPIMLNVIIFSICGIIIAYLGNNPIITLCITSIFLIIYIYICWRYFKDTFKRIFNVLTKYHNIYQ